MKDMESRVQEAFDAVTLPPEVKQATFAYIEQARQTQENKAPAAAQQDAGVCQYSFVETQETKKPVVTVHQSKESKRGFTTRREKKTSRWRTGWALAACLLLGVFGFGGFQAYATETAFVAIEMNPSIELGINRFGIVVDARALNEDGQEVLNKVSVTGQPYDKALATITGSEAFTTYISDTSFIDINVVCDNANQAAALINQSDTAINALPYEGTCHHSSSEQREEAYEAGMGLARYEAAMELLSLDSTLVLEDCKHMTMRELRERITALDPENDYAHHGNGKHNGSGSGRGNGYGGGSGNSQGQNNGQSVNEGHGNAQGQHEEQSKHNE